MGQSIGERKNKTIIGNMNLRFNQLKEDITRNDIVIKNKCLR